MGGLGHEGQQQRRHGAAARLRGKAQGLRVQLEMQDARRADAREPAPQLHRRTLRETAPRFLTLRRPAGEGVLALLAAGVGLHRDGALRRFA